MSFFFGSAKKQKPAADAAPPAGASIPAKPGTPLELVRYSTDTGKFEIPPEALAVLKGIRGPVGVVSVCGRARQASSALPPPQWPHPCVSSPPDQSSCISVHTLASWRCSRALQGPAAIAFGPQHAKQAMARPR